MELLQTSFSRALNHLLQGEGWARERLAPFAGETVEFRALPLPSFRLRIAQGGLVERAEIGAEASLVVSAKPGVLLAFARGPEHSMRDVEISGNARLASEILFLAQHLRWDAEEDLSRLVGDVVAHRMVGGAKGAAAAALDTGRRLAAAVMEYAVEEQRLLVSREEHDALADGNARLRDALERLEKRLERLG